MKKILDRRITNQADVLRSPPVHRHSSGQWTTGKPFQAFIEGRGECRLIGIGNGSVHIGYVSITTLVPQAEAEANANLIIAAPAILEFVHRYLDSESTTLDLDIEAKRLLALAEGNQ